MKTKFFSIIYALVMMLALTACSDSNTSDLLLDGNCDVTALKADTYDGIINKAARTITVRVPEGYDVSNMKVSALSLSHGAQSNIKEGDALNLLAPQVMHVTNGDVYLDWTISALHDEAKITSFKINGTYIGIVNEEQKTISVFVPNTLNLASLTPTITISANATISPENGVATDFTHPVKYTVTNNTASATYTVTVTAIGKPSAVYVGLAPSMDQLNIEEQTACNWMLANIPNSLYASFDDIQNGTVDLSECKVIWWHFHKDGGIDGKEAFEKAAPEAINSAVALRDYYNNGGSFLFTRYATNMPAEIGAVTNDACPNNCWGQNEGPWSFSILGHTNHPLFQNLVMKDGDANAVYTCDAGYRITNSTAQWHIGSDWGGYPDYAAWRSKTGATDLAYGGDGAIVAWEFPAANGHGDILCIGSGCYDWYSVATVPNEVYHANVARMTKNAFNYLMNK